MLRSVGPWMLALCCLTAGCETKNSNFCAGADFDNCLNGVPIDGRESACRSSTDCPGAVCDVTGSHTCVECTAEDTHACVGATPLCAGTSCRGCETSAECTASNVCLTDGSCAVVQDVAYVDSTATDDSVCSKNVPCQKVTTALQKNTKYIKITGTLVESVSIDHSVAIFADPGAALMSNGSALRVSGSADVEVHGLQITGAGDPAVSVQSNTGKLSLFDLTIEKSSGTAISVTDGSLYASKVQISKSQGIGIDVSGKSGNVVLSRSMLIHNFGGGLMASASYDITNTVIADNGEATTAFGGVRLENPQSPTHRFEFNTVTGNIASKGNVPGVYCGPAPAPVMFANNIVFDNHAEAQGPQGPVISQVSTGGCQWSYSDIGAGGDSSFVAGDGNRNTNPGFENPALGKYNLVDASQLRDLGDPTSVEGKDTALKIDYAGQPRPKGVAPDIGAFEIQTASPSSSLTH